MNIPLRHSVFLHPMHRSQHGFWRACAETSDTAGCAESIFLNDGALLHLRPIRPDDVDRLMRAFKRMTPEQVRARVFHVLNELPEPVARAMCRVNRDRAFALVATDADGVEIRGEARVHLDATTEMAELAIAVDPDFSGRGLGRILLEHLIEACRRQGIHEIWGDTQAGNSAMLALTSRLGFSHQREGDDASLVRFSLDLRAAAPDEAALNG